MPRYLFFFWCVITLLILCGCEKPQAPTIAPTNTLYFIKTPTWTITSSPSPVPSFTPTPSITPTPTVTLTPTITATPKPLPIPGNLSPKDFFLYLVQTNGGCELPCWWGIIPGSTTWDQVQELVSYFPHKIEYRKGARDYVIQISIDDWDPIIIGIMLDKRNTVYQIGIDPSVTSYRFGLNQLLRYNGSPSKVYIDTHKSAPGLSHGFMSLVLFYEHEHFYVIYNANAYPQDNQIQACFEGGPYVKIFSDEQNNTDEEILQWFFGPTPEEFPAYTLPAEKALGMTPEEFYIQHKNTGDNCVVTPLEIWP